MQELLFDAEASALAAAALRWIQRHWKVPDRDDKDVIAKRVSHWTPADFQIIAEEAKLPQPSSSAVVAKAQEFLGA